MGSRMQSNASSKAVDYHSFVHSWIEYFKIVNSRDRAIYLYPIDLLPEELSNQLPTYLLPGGCFSTNPSADRYLESSTNEGTNTQKSPPSIDRAKSFPPSLRRTRPRWKYPLCLLPAAAAAAAACLPGIPTSERCSAQPAGPAIDLNFFRLFRLFKLFKLRFCSEDE